MRYLTQCRRDATVVFTLSRDQVEVDIDYVLEHLPPALERLRSFSPLWRKKWRQ